MSTAPVALFTYNRPAHIRRTVESLALNHSAEQTDLFVFSDGPKSMDDVGRVESVRHYLTGIKGFRSVKVIHRTHNLGLAQSIIEGVTEVCRSHKRVIVLEDDMLTSPWFLHYMNDGLTVYKNDPEVISIHGYVFPVHGVLPKTFFLRGADCWGWATWEHGWKHFNPNGKSLLTELERRGLTHAFDFDGAYAYTTMLRDQIANKNNSWAIRWHASAFLLNKLTLYPGQSLVHNIGLDNSGTHCVATDAFATQPTEHAVEIRRQALKENYFARGQISEYLRGTPNKRPANWWSRFFGNPPVI